MHLSDCVLFVDTGYQSNSIQLDLFQTVNIKFDPSLKGEQVKQTSKRMNQENYNTTPYVLNNPEKEETLFSKICDLFN